MKSDEYQDRDRLGSAIIFMVGCNPYKGIEIELRVPKEIYSEYKSWEAAGYLIKKLMHRAKVEEILRKAGYLHKRK